VSTVPGVLAGSRLAAPWRRAVSTQLAVLSAQSGRRSGGRARLPRRQKAMRRTTTILSGPPNAVAAEPPNTTAAGRSAAAHNHEVFDVNAVRADFEGLARDRNGKPLIWFDNAATSRSPRR